MERRTFLRIKSKRVLQWISIIVILTIVFPISSSAFSGEPLRKKYNIKERANIEDSLLYAVNTRTYADALKEYEEKYAYPSTKSSEVVISPDAAKNITGGAAKIEKSLGSKTSPVLLWDDKAEGYEWNFFIETEGLYEVEMEYYPLPGEVSPIQRKLYIDGEVPFREAENILFNRKWEEQGDPFFDINGDEVNPKLAIVYEWSTTKAYDLEGFYSRPLKFYLKRGNHVLRLDYISSPVALGDIRIKTPETTKTYAELTADYAQKNYKKYTGSPLKVQAEEALYRSDQTIKRQYDADPCTEPSAESQMRLNTLGGWRWRNGNQEVTWVVDVPEDGLYKMAFRVMQQNGDGMNVYRQILIDGKVPFEELEAYSFAFGKNWRTEEVGSRNGKPYMFYLTKGRHEITLRIVTGEMTSAIEELKSCNLMLSKTIRDITKVTGAQPDLNFQYELDKKIPWVMEDLKALSARFKAQSRYISDISAKRPSFANSLITSSEELDSMVRYPDTIPAKLNDLLNMQTNLSNWYFTLQEQPLTLDYLLLAPPDGKIKNVQSTFLQKMKVTWLNFIRSFTKDYDSITLSVDRSKEESKNDDSTKNERLKVWVARGKEWGELIQVLADEEFTPETGIAVDVNIMPSGSVGAIGNVSPLMLSIISGDAPDVALGSDSQTPVELAIRDAIQDLKGFDGFNEVKDRFLPGAMTPLQYRGGTYALPETMDFPILFYRKDIMNELDVKIPQTWDDLYYKVLPVLKQNGLDFYTPSDFSMFLFQNGGSYYTKNGMRSGLDTDNAYKAFLQWTRNYTVYRMATFANLFNHFRMGDIPMCIGNYNDYIMIAAAAPELYERWDIADIPGTVKADGTIDRSAGGTVTSALMFRQTRNKDAAWKFMKWWTSTETQARFAFEIESLVGMEARWNTANVQAFKSLAWDKNHLAVFADTWKGYRNAPNVLGGYFTSRHVANAWTRTVMNNMKPRDSLEKAVEEINRELARKQKEYGLIPAEN